MGCAGNGARQHHLLRERLQRQRLRCCYVRLRARMAVLLTVFLSQLTVFLSLHGVQPLHYQTQYLGGVSITTYCVFIRRAFHGAWLCSYRNNCCVHIVFLSGGRAFHGAWPCSYRLAIAILTVFLSCSYQGRAFHGAWLDGRSRLFCPGTKFQVD
jgi:hypothetical protein